MNFVGVNKLMPSVCTMNLRYKTFILLFLRVRVHMRGKLSLLYGHHCISLELSTWSPDTTRDWLHADFYAWLDISSGVEKKTSRTFKQSKSLLITEECVFSFVTTGQTWRMPETISVGDGP